MFGNLANKISSAFERFKPGKIIKSSDVDAVIGDIKDALLEADVALDVVNNFCARVKDKAVGQEVLKNISPGEQFVKIVQDEIEELLGRGEAKLEFGHNLPDVFLMVGLQGSGKTTSTAKIGKYLKDSLKKKVLVASLDIYRPAAQEQLRIVAEQAGIDSLEIIEGEKPEKITKRALKEGKRGGYDILILDTAGRLSIDNELIDELKLVKKLSKPSETLLVADALSGQDAVITAKNFNDALEVTGLVMTRLDGDQRGGAALSMRYAADCDIKFIGTGEKIDDFELLKADRLASRILDMGDIVSLVEKAEEFVDEDEAKSLQKKFLEGKIDLNDLLKQIRTMRKMGGFASVLGMIPGAAKMKEMLKDNQIQEKDISRQEAIILSMTNYERKNPDKLNTSRKRRIASGCGAEIQDVNRLLKKFKDMQKMMKRMRNLDPNQIPHMLG